MVPAQDAGKKFQQMPVEEGLRGDKIRVNQILRKEGFDSGDEQLMENYYAKYELPLWTLPENDSKLPSFRKSIRNDLLAARSAPIHQKLNAILLDFMGKAAAGDYHPTARFNATLMLGDLNVRAPGRGEDPQPLPDALRVLLAALQDAKQIDAVRIGALLGIARHAKLGIADAEAQRQVAAAMLQISTSKKPADRSDVGHAWMRGRAISILGQLRSAGEQGAVAKTLAGIVSEADTPLSVRCAAARAIGNLNLDPQSGLDPAVVARAMGQLAADACKKEIELSRKDKQPLDPRTLKSELIAVRIGLTGSENAVDQPTKGLAALATKPEDKKLLTDIWKPIETWLGKLDNKALAPKPIENAGGFPPPAAAQDPAMVASDQLIEELSKDLEEFQKQLQATP